MIATRFLLSLSLSLAVAAALSACADREPYIFNPGEFNREREDFGRPVQDRAEAIICYAASQTTPARVRLLAAEACGQVGKKAVFKEHIVGSCPLATPAAARFDCVTP